MTYGAHTLKRAIFALALLLPSFGLASAATTARPPAHPRPLQHWVNPLGMEFIYLPPGTFLLGSPASEPGRRDSDQPQRRVKIQKGYWLGETEVTVGQYRNFAESTLHPSHGELIGFGWDFVAGKMSKVLGLTWHTPRFPQSDNYPVVFVSWHDATAFAYWLGSDSGLRYRLPTEVEWEYAARAGKTSPYPWGNATSGPAMDNCADQTSAADLTVSRKGFDWNDGYLRTNPVHAFPPNAWGFYGMAGNVHEWSRDWYLHRAPGAEPPRDARPAEAANWRATRGGSYSFDRSLCRIANRNGFKGEDAVSNLGFRVILEVR